MFENPVHDMRFAVRILRKSPGFMFIITLILGLGIGSTTAIFSVVNGVLLKPLPYSAPERLVEVKLNLPDAIQSNWGLSPADFFVYREQNRTFQEIGLYTAGVNSAEESVNVTGVGDPEHVPAQTVTASVLSILGEIPALGRSFTPADDQPGSADTVMLTYGYWRTKFGGDRSVLGKTIEVDGKARAIIGVLPPRFFFLERTKVAMFLPMKLDRSETRLGGYDRGAIARLKPGVTLAEASADVARMMPIVLRSFPPPSGASVQTFENLRLVPNLQPLKQEVVGNVGKVLWVLMGGIGLVLLMASANVANLLLVRADGRQQELALRAALGASRGRIGAELFYESLILALLSGFLGTGLAFAAIRALIVIAPTGLPRLNEIAIDGRVIVFALAVSLGTSVIFGLMPASRFSGAGLGTKLREGGRSLSESRQRLRSRGMLVILQVALALVLLIGSGLMIRTFRALTRVDPGFSNSSEVQTFRVYIPETQIKDPVGVVRIQKEIADKISALPGVSSGALAANLPMDGGGDLESVYSKDRVYSPGETPLCRYEYISPGFLKTVGTPLLSGRDFTWSDIVNKVPLVLVSEKFARDYWHNASLAVGKQIRGGPNEQWREIIGVVADVHQDGVDKEAPESVYLPVLTVYAGGDYVSRYVAFVLRSPQAGSEGLMNEVRLAVSSVDPQLPLAEAHTLHYYYVKSMARTSFTLVMLSSAGTMALLLGILGLYGVIAYSVSQRTHELGIRMALGAQRGDVLKLVLTQGIALTLIGVIIGIACASILTHSLSSVLYGVRQDDPLTFVAASILLITVALFACYIPARRAASTTVL
ncbi:MAG: ABC transporter permease [Bryobacteraceae bacterium]